jgi:hypothetical protein
MVAHVADGSRVVARFQDGRVLKGTTRDFGPLKPNFHLFVEGDESANSLAIQIGALKAVFFVKSWDGDARRVDDNSFEGATGQGRRVVVTFLDGEVMAGFTMGYAANKPGFFVIPADPRANNARVFVVSGAVRKVEWATATSAAFAAASRRR